MKDEMLETNWQTRTDLIPWLFHCQFSTQYGGESVQVFILFCVDDALISMVVANAPSFSSRVVWFES